MARFSRQDPSKQVSPKWRCDFEMPADLFRALEAFRADRKARRAHAVRMILADALRASGHLPRLKVPQDVPALEDVRAFPWSTPAVRGRPLPRLAWFSRDPSALTWATLFDAMERETETNTKLVAARHGLSYSQAYRTFRKFDLWRRGIDHRPRLDPFAGRPREGHNKGKRGNGPRSKKHGKAG